MKNEKSAYAYGKGKEEGKEKRKKIINNINYI